MLPLGDDNSDVRAVPIVNFVFIGLNILVFVFFQGLGADEKFTYAYATASPTRRTSAASSPG